MEQQGEQGAPSAVTAASGAASHSQSDGPGNGSFGGQVSPVSRLNEAQQQTADKASALHESNMVTLSDREWHIAT